MNNKDLMSEVIILKREYENICKVNNKLVNNQQKKIINEDIEGYLSKNNIKYKKEPNSTYSIVDFYCINEILTQEYGLRFILNNVSINTSFNIEIDMYPTFRGNITIIDEVGRNLSIESIIRQEYFIGTETLNEFINNTKERISLINNNIDYLMHHNSKEDYSYKYFLYNNDYIHKVLFDDFDKVMEYLKKSITEYNNMFFL